jgi:hypothetical protein
MNATDFARGGIACVPILYRTKTPEVRWQKYQSTLPTEPEMARWWRPGRQTNAAVVCGWKGLTVLDFDDFSQFIQWQAGAIADGGIARDVALTTYRVRTSRGIHLYLFVDDTPRCGKFKYGDIKAKGGYVLIPPSVHPSGHVYAAVDESAPILRVKSLDGIIPDPPKPPMVTLPTPTHVFATSSLWPATRIEQIKQALSILDFFPDAKQTGKNWYVAHCPWHDDRNESLWIDTSRGICACYAGCTQKPLDVIGVYARVRNIDNKEAVKELSKQLVTR